MDELFTVSVIITTRDEEHNIARCLDSILAQTVAPLEIVVVDNYSADKTAVVSAQRGARVVLHGPERCAQRNRGAAIAQGKYLLFIDADMELTRFLLVDCINAAKAGAQSVVIPERSEGSTFWAKCKALEKELYLGDPNIEAPRFFLRSAFIAAGGYNESLTAFEDWDLADRMDKISARTRVASFITHHEGALTLEQTFRKKRYYGQSFKAYKRATTKRQMNRLGVRRLLSILAMGMRHPVVAAGTVMMKLVELSGFVLGAYVYQANHK